MSNIAFIGNCNQANCILHKIAVIGYNTGQSGYKKIPL